MNYNQLSSQAHQNALAKGFWKENLSVEHALALVFTEICEAIEADRKEKYARKNLLSHINEIPDVSISSHKDIEFLSEMSISLAIFEDNIKDTVEDEFADTMIRLFDLAGHLQIDFSRLTECRYYRAFSRFSFTENAYALIKGLSKEHINIEKRILFALSYLKNWSEELGIDLSFHVTEKMKYNQSREAMHGKKY